MGFLLHQFSEIFRIRDATGKPYILIGGQAVNYWAERYLPSEPELASMRPFTSQDIDFKGDRDDVERIAEQLASHPSYPPKVAMTALAGIVPIKVGDKKSVVEVVRQVPGISDAVPTPAVEALWEEKSIRVLDPISLLASKLDLVATVPQDERQDVRHLRILVPCVRGFLREVLQQIDEQGVSARDWLNVASQVLKLTTTRQAKRIANKSQIDWSGILPLDAIVQSKDEKIRRFQEWQLQDSLRKTRKKKLV